MAKRKLHFFPETVQNEQQVKLNYKRLALLYHPDRGGSEERMRELNVEYDYLKRLFAGKETAKPQNTNEFSNISPGDTVFVNGTECIVVDVFKDTFIAQAKGRIKLAIFDKSTGYAVNNKKYKASLKNSHSLKQ